MKIFLANSSCSSSTDLGRFRSAQSVLEEMSTAADIMWENWGQYFVCTKGRSTE